MMQQLMTVAIDTLSQYNHEPLTDYARTCRITLEDEDWAQEEDDYHITVNKTVFDQLPDKQAYVNGIIVHNFLHTLSSRMWEDPIIELKPSFTVSEVDMYEEFYNARVAYLIHPDLNKMLVDLVEQVRVVFGGNKSAHSQLLEPTLTDPDQIDSQLVHLHQYLWQCTLESDMIFKSYILVVYRHRERLRDWWSTYWMVED